MQQVTGKQHTQESKAPLVSVIILTYCKFDNLQFTLNSIWNQDYPNLEILISDDGSPAFPNTEIAEWTKANDARGIRVTILRSETNRGIVQNARGAVQTARGQYIKFLSPGDAFSSSDSISSLVFSARSTKSLIVTSMSAVYAKDAENIRYYFPSRRKIRQLGRCSSKRAFEMIARKNIISAAATLYDRRYFEQYGLDSAYQHLDDWPVWLSFLRSGGKFGIVDKVTVLYQVDGSGASGKDAFESALLRNDLRHCYEKEICPYAGQFSLLTRWIVGYRCSLLEDRPWSLKERIQYCPLILLRAVKKCIKAKILDG